MDTRAARISTLSSFELMWVRFAHACRRRPGAFERKADNRCILLQNFVLLVSIGRICSHFGCKSCWHYSLHNFFVASLRALRHGSRQIQWTAVAREWGSPSDVQMITAMKEFSFTKTEMVETVWKPCGNRAALRRIRRIRRIRCANRATLWRIRPIRPIRPIRTEGRKI